MIRPPPRSTLFPYTDALPIYEEERAAVRLLPTGGEALEQAPLRVGGVLELIHQDVADEFQDTSRSEEHTSELQSHSDLVCRLLLEKKKKKKKTKYKNQEQKEK